MFHAVVRVLYLQSSLCIVHIPLQITKEKEVKI